MSRAPVATTTPSRGTASGVNADALISLRADMLRFARLQLRNSETAEDMVQEATEAALRHAESFAGNSTLKTWVFAILRNRIIDHLRRAERSVSISSLVADDEDWQDRLETLFNERGQWHDGQQPKPWPNPEESLQSRQFWAVFEACLEHLPANAARVFMMREFLDFESDEICQQLGISVGNCHVILHRARLKLRSCLENHWGPRTEAAC